MWEQCRARSGFRAAAHRLADGLRRCRAPTLLPSFTTQIVEVLSPTNPLGIKAGGEGGTTAAPAVIVSAIVDALKSYNILNLEMPATPYRIWQAIQNAKSG